MTDDKGVTVDCGGSNVIALLRLNPRWWLSRHLFSQWGPRTDVPLLDRWGEPLLFGPGSFLVAHTDSLWVAVALISLAVALHQAWATNMFTTASDMFPREAVSSVVGIGGMTGAIGGILFPMLVGYLLDSYKAEGNLSGGYNLLFTICGFTYLVAWTIIHLLTRGPRTRVNLNQLF